MDCPFAAQSLNLADQSLADEHTDLMNLVFGICCILPLGNFNPKRSAQLILKEARVIIELAPGDLFYFPSANINHESAPLASEEELRKSFIMYSAGGLFRWVTQGFRLASESKKPSAKEAAKEGARRWAAGWKLFSTITELRGSR